MKFTPEEHQALASGLPVDILGHRYAVCSQCRSIVKLTGWLGGLHLCDNPNSKPDTTRKP